MIMVARRRTEREQGEEGPRRGAEGCSAGKQIKLLVKSRLVCVWGEAKTAKQLKESFTNRYKQHLSDLYLVYSFS